MKRMDSLHAGGVTLIELLVALAVTALIAAFAAPAFSGAFERIRLRGTSDEIALFFAQARHAAVASHRDVSISLRGGDGTWCLGARSNAARAPVQPCDCGGDAAACEVDGETRVLVLGDDAIPLDAAGFALVFDGRRGSLDPPSVGELRLASRSHHYVARVTVLPLGQVRSCLRSVAAGSVGAASC